MKKLLLSFGVLVLVIFCLIAQTPQSFKYQAVARDNLENIIADQDVGLRISILEGSASGTVVYTEIHLPHTNQFGLFNLSIGQGTVIAGNLANISWGTNTYFIQTEMDPAGGTTYVLMGTSQLLSVPYALYSENTENVNDADADPTNELQTLSKVGKYIELSNGGGSVIDEVDDADYDATNELQTISKTGSTVTLSNGGGSFNDAVDDADNKPSNELQTLSVNGSNLSISSGNTVSLPSVLPTGSLGKTLYHNGSNWVSSTDIFNNGINIGIGTTSPAAPFHVNKSEYASSTSMFNNSSNSFGANAIKATAVYDASGYLGVQGDNYFDGTDLHIFGKEIGVLGLSIGTSVNDNYGVYGYSNGEAVYGEHSVSGRVGHLGGSYYGAYGQYSSDRYGYLGGYYGAYGQYTNTRYGYLGGSLYAVYGKYSNDCYGYIGSPNNGVYGFSNTYSGGYGGYFKKINTTGSGCGVYAASEYNGGSSFYTSYGIYVESKSTSQDQVGIYNDVEHTGSSGEVYGQNNIINVASGNSDIVFGAKFDIERDDDAGSTYGLCGYATNGTFVYGILGLATGGSVVNYAGCFSGNLAYTGSLISLSDRKFKEDFKKINGSLEKIKQLSTYNFVYKTTGEAEKLNLDKGRHYGFIAQELETLFPELVSDDVHPYRETVREGDKKIEKEFRIEYKGVNYIGMIPVLTQAIKDQQEIIENQQSAIEKQQKEIDKLKVLVGQLME